MFYLYINGDLISCSETFSEVHDILFGEIFKDCKYIEHNTKTLLKYLDQLFSHHHCLFTIQDKNNPDLKMRVEVYHG